MMNSSIGAGKRFTFILEFSSFFSLILAENAVR